MCTVSYSYSYGKNYIYTTIENVEDHCWDIEKLLKIIWWDSNLLTSAFMSTTMLHLPRIMKTKFYEQYWTSEKM